MNIREIKFRAWDEENKEMINDIRLGERRIELWRIEENKDRLMQFTGLKDKNGKEIYEGDIVKYRGFDDNDDYFYEVYQFESGEWMACNELWNDLKSADFKIIEVIGNVWENPELLN